MREALLLLLLSGCAYSPRLDVPCDFWLGWTCFVSDPAAPPAAPLSVLRFQKAMEKSAAAWGVPTSALSGWQVIVTSGELDCGREDAHAYGGFWGCTWNAAKVIQIYDMGTGCPEGILPHEYGHAAAGFHNHNSPIFAKVNWPETGFLTPELPECTPWIESIEQP